MVIEITSFNLLTAASRAGPAGSWVAQFAARSGCDSAHSRTASSASSGSVLRSDSTGSEGRTTTVEDVRLAGNGSKRALASDANKVGRSTVIGRSSDRIHE